VATREPGSPGRGAERGEKEGAIAELLETVIEAYGGLDRWNQFHTVTAHLAQGGVFWALKGQAGVLDDVFVTASLHEERVSHYPFGAPGRRSAFTPERIAIETDTGTVLEALGRPRASFAGQTLETPWTTLQLAYFAATAMWTYLTQPFTLALPGFKTTELEPWKEQGEQWRRLRVTWPPHLATHSTEQTLYIGDDGLIRRHDYDVEIAAGNRGAHYISGYTQVAGIMIPTRHRIFPRAEDGQALTDPLLVSIDLSQVTFA
jgi:hypothetical protein